MDAYQKNLIDLFSKYRPEIEYPYPSYHEGPYLEAYFLEKFLKEKNYKKRYLIPVFWTTCYNYNKTEGLQELIDSLDTSLEYFTVAQHDDAIRERLPINTICFNAGGNGGGVPIPLICSPIKEDIIPHMERDIFCSFVGSVTHHIRQYMIEILHTNNRYYLAGKQWSSTISQSDFNTFVEVTSRSIFSLCPRGYGKTSFRMYEAMQLGAIPVFIYDEKWMPFEDEIDWNEFSVLVHASQLHNIDAILSSYDNDRIKNMQNNLSRYWKENFTMESTFEKIIEKI